MKRRQFGHAASAARARCARVRAAADAGFVSLYVVVLTLGLLAVAGLVIDGGNALAAREQAADVAQQAARAGADALSPDSLRGSPAGLTASPSAAQSAANAILDTAHVTGTVIVVRDNVTVTVVVHQRTTILSAFGVPSIEGRATATATALHGTTTGDS